MKVRYDRLFPGRIFQARLTESMSFFGGPAERPVLEIDADGAPLQLEPPCVLDVVEATAEEWAALQAAGYELPGPAPVPDLASADDNYDRGCALLASGDCDAAIESFSRALALNAEDAQAYYNRGYAYAVKLQRLPSLTVEIADGTRLGWRGPEGAACLDAAIEDFTQALFYDAGMVKAYGMRAEMYWLRGLDELAVADYQQAVRLGDETAARLLRERFDLDQRK
jgi:tetratricopeptide (TPR) repeat protein